MRIGVSSVVFVMLLTPAHATGGFSCEADDANIKFEAGSALGSGMGAPILKLETSFQVKLKDVPSDLAAFNLNDALVHSWMAHPDLNLHFYKERDPSQQHGYIELVIRTKVTDEDLGSEGSYALSVYEVPATGDSKTWNAEGKISCMIE